MSFSNWKSKPPEGLWMPAESHKTNGLCGKRFVGARNPMMSKATIWGVALFALIRMKQYIGLFVSIEEMSIGGVGDDSPGRIFLGKVYAQALGWCSIPFSVYPVEALKIAASHPVPISHGNSFGNLSAIETSSAVSEFGLRRADNVNSKFVSPGPNGTKRYAAMGCDLSSISRRTI